MRRGIELGFFNSRAILYDGTEPVAIDAQAGKGKLTRFLGVNLVSPRTAHLTKIITDPKDAELAWMSWLYRPSGICTGQAANANASAGVFMSSA